MTIKNCRELLKKGKLVRIHYVDIGARDGVVFQTYSRKEKYFGFFDLTDYTTRSINFDQVLSVGPFLSIPPF